MALSHAKPAEVVDIRPLGANIQNTQTTTLIKTDSLEIIRLVLPAEKVIEPHRVPGEITVQCLEGYVLFHTGDTDCELSGGELIFLTGATEHSVRAVEDSTLLVTILLNPRQ